MKARTKSLPGLVLLGVVSVVMGCATTEYMGQVMTPEKETEIRARHPWADLTVTLDRGGDSARFGRLIKVGDAQSQIEFQNGDTTVDNRKIDEIKVAGHLRGALEGLGWGVLGGAAGGAAIAAVGCPSGKNGCWDADKGGAVIVTGVGGAIIGAAVGAIVGGLVGHRTTYWFE
jgi:hypothetical protein